MRRKYVIVFLALSSVIALSWLGWRGYSGPKIRLVEVTASDMVKTIVASGHVQNPNRIDISARITSTVDTIDIQEGQHVKKGQLLLTLSSEESRAELNSAQAAVVQAKQHVLQLQKLSAPVAHFEQAQAQANLKNAEKNLARTHTLFEQDYVGEAAKDEAERLTQIARAQAAINDTQWMSLQPGGSEMTNAHAALKQALANVEAAKARLAYTRLMAPQNGILISRNAEVGDGVQPGKLLLVLSPDGPTELVIQIDEKNMKWVRKGLVAIASADAFTNKSFAAVVVFVNPAVDPLRGSVEVKLQIKDAPVYLLQDMTVTVDIAVETQLQAVQIPASQLHDAGSLHPWVLVFQNGKALKTEVALGMQDHGFVQVVSGLNAGQWLVPPTLTDIHHGSRLRAATP